MDGRQDVLGMPVGPSTSQSSQELALVNPLAYVPRFQGLGLASAIQ